MRGRDVNPNRLAFVGRANGRWVSYIAATLTHLLDGALKNYCRGQSIGIRQWFRSAVVAISIQMIKLALPDLFCTKKLVHTDTKPSYATTIMNESPFFRALSGTI